MGPSMASSPTLAQRCVYLYYPLYVCLDRICGFVQVNPYSAIYFYQFTAPGSPNKTWTTRFTIASPTGETVPPPNANQPGSNAAIPWGVGALADPSTANPPPTAGPAASGAGTGTATGTNTATTRTTTTAAAATTSGLTRTTTGTNSPTGTRNTTAAASQTADSGAIATVGHNFVLGSVLAIASSLLAVSL